MSSVQLACLCAAWCRLCDGYAQTIHAVAAEFPEVVVRWIDIEDEEALLGELDIETFPTVLLHHSGRVLFAGVVEPQPQRLRRLLAAAMEGGVLATGEPDPAFAALAQRLAAEPAGD